MGPLERECVMLTKLRDNSCKKYRNFVAIAAPSCVAILLSSAFACICFLFTHTSISVSVYTPSRLPLQPVDANVPQRATAVVLPAAANGTQADFADFLKRNAVGYFVLK